MLAWVLQPHGYETLQAATGKEGIEKAIAAQPGLILLDIRLPDMSGHEFMLKLKQFLDPVPLILMTGYGYDPGHNIVKCSQEGLPKNSVLCKPFRLDQLVSVVEHVIQSTPKPVEQAS